MQILDKNTLYRPFELEVPEDDIPSPYCEKCGHCGEIGCCGIRVFLENHVRGKTDCMYEDEILDEIEEWFDMQKEEK